MRPQGTLGEHEVALAQPGTLLRNFVASTPQFGERLETNQVLVRFFRIHAVDGSEVQGHIARQSDIEAALEGRELCITDSGAGLNAGRTPTTLEFDEQRVDFRVRTRIDHALAATHDSGGNCAARM